MPSAQRCAGDSPVMSRPAYRTRPESGAMVPPIMANSVAVRPDNPERLALTKIKVEAFGDDDRTEAFGDLFKREQRRGHDHSDACAAFAFAIAAQIA